MNIVIEISGLLLGLVGLWIGTQWTINNAIKIAKRYQLSDLFVGMGILAIGSDLPELAVAIDAGIRTLQGANATGIVIGTSIGSAFAQIGLVLGITGFTGYLLIGRKYLVRHGTVLLGSIAVLWLVSYDGMISRFDGFTLLIVFAIYFLLLVQNESDDPTASNSKTSPVIPTWLALAGGIIIVIAASEITVYTAISLAHRLQISPFIIATFIVGIGTSLPELSISLAAIRKKRGALSVGNILGSNIFDTLVPIGVAAIIIPISADRRLLVFDLPALMALSVLVLVCFLNKRGLQRKEALAILAAYGCYAVANLFYT